MLRPLKLALLTLLTLLYSCDMIRDDQDDCGFYLEFFYDYNMQYTCLFTTHVPSVSVYFFDENETFLFMRYADVADLINGRMMHINKELTWGNYKVLAVGGLCEHYGFHDAEGNECQTGVTTLQDVRLALQRDSDDVSQQFSTPVWLSQLIEVTYPGNNQKVPVSLIRETNHFTINLTSTTRTARADEGDAPYTFKIITPEGGVYGYDNSPLRSESVSYSPYSLTAGAESLVEAKINTMRLLDTGNSNDYQLKVYSAVTGEELWSYNLMTLLSYSKPSTISTLQEYLDREYDWTLTLGATDTTDAGFVALYISVNGWILWLNDIDL